MKVVQTAIPDVLIFEPRVFGDERGFFLESWYREMKGYCIVCAIAKQLEPPAAARVRGTAGLTAINLWRPPQFSGSHLTGPL